MIPAASYSVPSSSSSSSYYWDSALLYSTHSILFYYFVCLFVFLVVLFAVKGIGECYNCVVQKQYFEGLTLKGD